MADQLDGKACLCIDVHGVYRSGCTLRRLLRLAGARILSFVQLGHMVKCELCEL